MKVCIATLGVMGLQHNKIILYSLEITPSPPFLLVRFSYKYGGLIIEYG